MNVGEKFKKLRLGKKKTLKDLSTVFGVSVNSVYRWEHSLAVPRKPMLQRIADFFEVPLLWLLHDGADDIGTSDDEPFSESDTETQLLRIYRMLSDNSKYKVLGYLERIYIETMEEKN